jgi:hypothetical protein
MSAPRRDAATNGDLYTSPTEVCWRFDYAIEIDELRNLYSKWQHPLGGPLDLERDRERHERSGAAGAPCSRYRPPRSLAPAGAPAPQSGRSPRR